MANLGSMILQLGANVVQLQTDMGKAASITQQAADKMTASMQRAADGIQHGFSDIAGKLVAAFSVEKLIEFGNKSIELADQMGKLAQKTGSTVEAVSALAVQAQLSDVGIDQLQLGMTKLSKVAEDAASGGKQSAAAFKAIGVAVLDANGHLKPTEELLASVAAKFATYKDTAEKTAAAQAIFGKSGAELIPLLNELGEKGMAGVTAQAKELGLVISQDAAKAANEFNDNVKMLSLEAQGFAQSVTQQLLPALNNIASSMVDAGKSSTDYATSTANAIKGIIFAFLALKEGIAEGVTALTAFYDSVKLTFSTIGGIIDAWGEATKKTIAGAFHLDGAAIDAAKVEFQKKIDSIASQFDTAKKGIKEGLSGGIKDGIDSVNKAYDSLFGTFSNVAAGSSNLTKHLHEQIAPLIANADAADKAARAAQKLAEAELGAQKFIDDLSGKIGGPYEKAMSQYAAAIAEANKWVIKLTASGEPLVKVQQFLAEATKIAADNFQSQTDATQILDRVIGDITVKYAEQNRLIGLTGTALEVETEYLRLKADADKALLGVMGPLTEAQQKQLDSLHGLAEAHVELAQKAKLSQEAAHEWSNIWSQAGNSIADTFAKVLVEGGSFMKSLTNIAKQVVEQIIAYFAKLAVINPILNSIFGAIGGSMLPTMANAGGIFGGAGGGGGLLGLFTGGGGGASGSAGGFSLFSPSSWIDAGKNLWSGFQSLWGGGSAAGASLTSGAFGGQSLANPGGYFTSQVTGPQSFAGAAAAPGALGYGGYGSAIGQGLGVVGGIYAGYNAYNNAGGGLGGAAAGVAYGAGTYFAGAAVTSALAGGVAAGFAAVPVVGWIAIAAMLIDKFSGGKLFGTSWQTKQADVSLNIGPDGGGASTTLWQTKQGALFSGTKNRDKTVESSPDAIKAAQDFYDQILKTMTDGAKALGIEVPPVIEASLHTVTEYDKKGHAKATKYLVDAFGQQWEEATAELAAKRIQADAILKTISATDVGKDAIAIAAQFQSSADTLAEAAQAMLAATADIQSGHGLLGLTGTLADTVAEIAKLQSGDESLLQTYARLQQQTQYLRDAYEQMGIVTTKTGAAFVEFTDDLVKAAGGLQNLQTLLNSYFQNYYSNSERAAANLAYLQKQAQTALAAVGENAGESMADFRAHFEAVRDSLSAVDTVKWLEAAQALFSLDQALGTTQAQAEAAKQAQAQAAAAYDQFLAPFRAATDGLDDFEHALVNMGVSLQATIAQADALAKAAGMSGANAQDIAKIITVAAQQGAAALQQLEQNAQQLSSTLYGQDYINGLLEQLKRAGDTGAGIDIRRQIREAQGSQAQQADNSRFLNAQQLAREAAEIAATGGGNINEILKSLGVPMGAFAKDLHLQSGALTDYLQNLENQAAAALNTAGNTEAMKEYLQDIRDILAGKPLSYDGSQQPILPGDKPGGHGFKPPAQSFDLYMQHPAGTRGGGGAALSVIAGQGAPQSGTTTTAANDPVATAINNNTSQVVEKLDHVVRRLDALERSYTRKWAARA